MRATINQYLRNWDTCARIKPVRHAPFGYLKPLEIPRKHWDSISLDFITGLFSSSAFDAILVAVDMLTKMSHFIPTTTTCSEKELALLLRNHVFRLHVLLNSVVSDRDPVFTSNFAREMTACLSIDLRFSTAFQPQIDGQTERVNSILEQYLRGYCNYQQDNWHDYLSLAEFSYNNSISSSTKVSSFFANYGFNPRYQIFTRSTDYASKSVEIKHFQPRLKQLEDYIKAEMFSSQYPVMTP
ncbi:hypothetical protein K3495_g6861 [Podosphaera aphanis]|nr:hypothetical protein K3495_g6861 [Podosphaera aphanis]